MSEVTRKAFWLGVATDAGKAIADSLLRGSERPTRHQVGVALNDARRHAEDVMGEYGVPAIEVDPILDALSLAFTQRLDDLSGKPEIASDGERHDEDVMGDR